jgi:hypothetical protein
MTSPSNGEGHPTQAPGHRNARRAAPLPTLAAAIAGALAVVVLAAGCGSANGPGSAGPGRGATTASAFGRVLAYAGCMRSHGMPDFPDPVSSTDGRHVTIAIHAGPSSDLDPDNPAFQVASEACRSLLPSGGVPTTPVSSQKLAQELQWARCLRAHGIPNFPDPSSQAAFDYAQVEHYVDQFDANSPLVVHAAHACRPYQPGSIDATPRGKR